MKKKIISDIFAIVNAIRQKEACLETVMMLNDLEYRVNLLKNLDDKSKIRYDVILFSVVPVEHDAVMSFFSLTDASKLTINFGIQYYSFSIQSIETGKLPISVLYACVGSSGQSNMSLVCSRTFEIYESKITILCGIAAGNKSEVKIYDTVVSIDIVDYEMQRWNTDKIDEYRLEHYGQKDNTYKRQVGRFVQKESFELTKSTVSLKQKYDKVVDDIDKFKCFSITDGVIASGSKLMADSDRFDIISNNIRIKKGAKAADMEGGGFCPMFEEYNNESWQKWVVIRGISDYGGSDKNKPINKRRQIIAALHAIKTANEFIRFYFTNP